jgi:hypothetical protein
VSFQIVELALDANGDVIERKVVPYPYPTRQEAVATVKSIAAKYRDARFDSANNVWCAVEGSGSRVRFAIEETVTRPRKPLQA